MIVCPICNKILKISNYKYYCQECNKDYQINDGITHFVSAPPKESFDPSFFEKLAGFEDDYFWFKNRREIIIGWLNKYCSDVFKQNNKALELGCGGGQNLSYFKQKGINVEGGDLFLEGLKRAKKRLPKTILFQLDAMSLPFLEEYNLIGLFDVLEHIDDDLGVLREIYKALKPKGAIMITVPAGKYLYTRHDEVSFHKRRYSAQELSKKLSLAGFRVKRISYFVFLLLPIVLISRYLLDKKYRAQRINGLLVQEFEISKKMN